ncbi:MAG TPA: tyrosine-type recombinase/integrase, partial [Terriglobales bacterium]
LRIASPVVGSSVNRVPRPCHGMFPTHIISALPSASMPRCAATALRTSELLALRWADVLWDENRIAVTKRWWRGSDGPTKTRRSEGHVPMHPALAQFLQAWKEKTPFAKETDFLFPSLKADGRVPISPAVFVADHLRPAAKAAGLEIPDGYRFGLHNLRHSLSSWLVNKGKIEPKTVQSLLRHSVSTPRSTFTPRATAMKHGLLKARFFERWAWHRSQCNENVG